MYIYHQKDASFSRVADPALFAREQKVGAVAHGGGAQRERVRTRAGLGEAEGAWCEPGV